MDKYGYIGIETLLNYCENSKDHAVTPNDFMRMKRVRMAEPHWIPCSERLPEEYGNYLATMDDGDVQECTYSPEKNTPFMRGGWSTCEADGIVFLDIAEVTAWQPLPEPYREGES